MQYNSRNGMRLKAGKGFVYTLEVLIVVGILFFVLVYLFKAEAPEARPDLTILKKSGFEALEFMDQYYNLKEIVNKGNASVIDPILTNLLPDNIQFETEICKDECIAVGLPGRVSVVTIDYYISTDRNEYSGYKVRMWLWQ